VAWLLDTFLKEYQPNFIRNIMKKQLITLKKSTDSFSDLINPGKNNLIHGLNKKRKICFLILISAGLLLDSCSHYYYVPASQNVPLFKEKNEFRISGTYGEGRETQCVEIQAAYSVTDKIGIMSDFMSVRGGNIYSLNYGKGNYFDGALGYYKPLGNFGVFEIYGGLGRCGQHHEYSNYYYNQSTGYANLSFTKLFVQPSIGLTSHPFDIALSTRISRITFDNIENHISADIDSYNELNALSDKSHFFFEPGITIRGGWKSVKAQVQAVYSWYLNNPKLYFGENYHISLGLYFALGKKPK
jgi:hypothetical protein